MGHLPLTYFQTLVNVLADTAREASPARNGSGSETDAELVDVDQMIRKGQRSGFGA